MCWTIIQVLQMLLGLVNHTITKQMLQNHIVRIVPDSGHERCSGGNGIGNGNLDGARTGVDQILQSEQFYSKDPTGALYVIRRAHLSN